MPTDYTDYTDYFWVMPVFRGGEFIGEIGFEKVLLWEVYKEIKGNLIGLNRSSRGGATRKNLRNLRNLRKKIQNFPTGSRLQSKHHR
jgi:hypothetical protein